MGVTTIFCWADMVSEGFWLKQASEKGDFFNVLPILPIIIQERKPASAMY
jgi:hypothetical protein